MVEQELEIAALKAEIERIKSAAKVPTIVTEKKHKLVINNTTILKRVLVKDEKVMVSFGAKDQKKIYVGTYDNGAIDGKTASGWVKSKALEHYGATHKTEYNGFIKAYVERGGVSYFLSELRLLEHKKSGYADF